MAVFVDPLQPSPGGPGPFRAGALFCHLQAADLSLWAIDDLHRIADVIGMKQGWFKPCPPASWPHYDLTPSRRDAAVRAGAIQESVRDGAARRVRGRRMIRIGDGPKTDGAPCPFCGGELFVIIARAWCIKRVAEGGCAAFWQDGKLASAPKRWTLTSDPDTTPTAPERELDKPQQLDLTYTSPAE